MKKKKLLSVLIAAALSCCLFSAVPVVSQAWTRYKEVFSSGDWEYCLEYSVDGGETYTVDDGCAIFRYSGSDTNVTIPSTLDGWTVKEIWGAFEDNKEITSVIIPDTVQVITGGFNGCTGLTNVDLGNSVTDLGYYCFYNCDSLTSIELPASMTSSEARAISPFSGCDSLKNITLASNSVKIPDQLFGGCNALEKISIPDSVKEIGEYAFVFCSSLKEITIPDSVSVIKDSTFYDCSSLKRVRIPDSVQTIEFRAFGGCDSLEEIKIPNLVQAIGNYAFDGCKSLKEVTIGDSVESIGDCAFTRCEALTKIILPDSVKSVGGGAFSNCTSLKDFYAYNANTEYSDEYFDNFYGRIVNEPVFQKVPSLTIHGYPGSTTETYAKEHGIAFVPLTEEEMDERAEEMIKDGKQMMRRLYNPNTGEHFYTSNATEKNNLVSFGWSSEGTAWTAPISSNTPVYRVYNPNSGEHHYTMNSSERDMLVGIGWNNEGIGWYSDDNQGTPLYRLYNPNATGQYEAGGHHYTKDVNEKNSLIANGWRDEGIGWYGK